ncbi:MAG: Transcriptional regulator, TrmB [Candidatus Peribacteria bacterium GW2011_GWB1_54_5]|nr:MAG: Transcriptional regulator, TrmB [Candidatus Peribacteria bacterium GW2011_GWB1_54_5]KKW40620.1 MAG: Transcriptional regulator, TrmB [Candidatus Peribacteria bacterium GW2011_GWC2_54_8]
MRKHVIPSGAEGRRADHYAMVRGSATLTMTAHHDDMITDLLKLGLSDEEAKVYLACLEINGGPVSTIARKAGVHRVSCYHTLENLLEKRLLSQYNKNGVKCFAPEPPEQLEQLAKERVNIARGLLPQLKTLASSQRFKPKIRFYEGRDGVERVFSESLSAEEEILGYTNLKTVTEFFPSFFRSYTHERLQKGIKTRYLSPNTVETVHVIDPFLPASYDPNLIEILLVNKEQFPFENEVLIFGNTVGIVSLKTGELLGLLVESSTFARTMKAVFDLAWLGATAFVAK